MQVDMTRRQFIKCSAAVAAVAAIPLPINKQELVKHADEFHYGTIKIYKGQKPINLPGDPKKLICTIGDIPFKKTENSRGIKMDGSVSGTICRTGEAKWFLLESANGSVVYIGSVGNYGNDMNLSSDFLNKGENFQLDFFVLEA